jgi:hypothetical protein
LYAFGGRNVSSGLGRTLLSAGIARVDNPIRKDEADSKFPAFESIWLLL